MSPERGLAISVLLFAAACFDNSGDFESNCTLSCSLADGGTLENRQRVACCGQHDSPSHSGEEGSACTVDWVNGHAQQLCQTRSLLYGGPDGGLATLVCPASQFQCKCSAPSRYPSDLGCD